MKVPKFIIKKILSEFENVVKNLENDFGTEERQIFINLFNSGVEVDLKTIVKKIARKTLEILKEYNRNAKNRII
jgi:DNA-binding ferritin-like protein (Dps family)